MSDVGEPWTVDGVTHGRCLRTGATFRFVGGRWEPAAETTTSDVAREQAAHAALLALVNGKEKAPPLWALYDEAAGRVGDVCAVVAPDFLDGGKAAKAALRGFGWVEAVDAEGRSR